MTSVRGAGQLAVITDGKGGLDMRNRDRQQGQKL